MPLYPYKNPDMAAAIRDVPLSLPDQAEAKEGYLFQRWAYVGRDVAYNVAGKGKRKLETSHLWLGEDGELKFYSSGNGHFKTGAKPGMVYAVHVKDEDGLGSVRWGGAMGPHFLARLGPEQWTGRYNEMQACREAGTPVERQVLQWASIDFGQAARLVNLKTEKALQARSLVHECLEPLRDAYRQTSAQGQSVLLAQIIQYMTRGL